MREGKIFGRRGAALHSKRTTVGSSHSSVIHAMAAIQAPTTAYVSFIRLYSYLRLSPVLARESITQPPTELREMGYESEG
ncbi:uncharacterized protein AtWU_04364 [Aspergillus tubingensis]|uniref:uncharacterized protein n=1 Tax=Aspergillus tubingensis TaxID=5068 RepID=UPI001578D4AF|nr:uncharacterized protein AtWU_04364 [Aspergillus tubingensis]GFN14564.1 hypothetical protein AtWU_04364 [Aspergillus tubingensis]